MYLLLLKFLGDGEERKSNDKQAPFCVQFSRFWEVLAELWTFRNIVVLDMFS